ncbi:MAG: ATP-binding cassette domain-containing protein, partial [Myxococcota bacterium]|nr:ATP-binding cassette domain-containing protein [Myxococcota bacterium]
MPSLEIHNISKRYGSHKAVHNLSFSIEEGQIVGFLGPNGAGKSTTMKIICGFITADQGSVHINGCDILSQRIEAQKQIGYLPESNPLYPELRVEEYLNYCAKIRNLGRSQRALAIDRVVSLCGLTERRKQNIGELSKGYRQRVGLAQALLHDPPILVLDEPTTGLDPNQIGEIRNLIREIGQR